MRKTNRKAKNADFGILFANQSQKSFKPELIGYADLEYARVMLALKILENAGSTDYLLTVMPWALSVKDETQVLLNPAVSETTKRGFPLLLEGNLIWCGTVYRLSVEVQTKPSGNRYLRISLKTRRK